MKRLSATEISAMPIQQRIQLVEEIWDSIVETPEAVGIPEWHQQVLDKRMKDYQADPEQGSSWQDVKKRILG